MGPGERLFIEYIGRQSTSEADDGRRGPHEGCAENQSWDVTPEHAVHAAERTQQRTVLSGSASGTGATSTRERTGRANPRPYYMGK